MRVWRIDSRSAAQTQALVEHLARLYGGLPHMRDCVAALLNLYHVAPRDERGMARAIWTWVTHNVRFLNEAGEVVQTPAKTLRARFGDCDDRTSLVCAMLESIRIPWRTQLLSRNGVPYHIWPQARVGGRWIDLETSDERARFGEHPDALMRRIAGLSL